MADPFGSKSGPFNGIRALPQIAGVAAFFPPHWAYLNNGSAMTTTINRLYFIPYYFLKSGLTYTGLGSRNTGTGDSTEKYRQGIYQADSITGLPSTLVQDCGEVTIGASAATNLLAVAWTAPYEGWGYVCHHAQTAAAVLGLQNIGFSSTDVGLIQAQPSTYMFGTSTLNQGDATATFGGYFVDTAYGALAANAVAPTGIVTLAPIAAPYRT